MVLAGCTQPNVYQEPPPPTVKVARPVIQTVTDYLEETATTEAVERVEVRARVEGFLKSLDFEAGSDVTAGDVLFQIEPELYEARVASAQADLLAQESLRKKAQIEKDRQERVRARDAGATSETAVVAAQAEFEGAEAAVKQAEAQLKQAQIDLGYTKVIAPIGGRVGKTLIKQGNLVGSGGEATKLTTVIQYDPIFANFNISERALLDLQEDRGDREEVKIRKTPIYLSRLNDKGYPFQGELDYADLAVDQSTGTFMARGIFANPDRKIVPGLFVRVRIPVGTQENALLIPERATAADQAGRYALIVNDQNEVERRNVTLGTKVGEMVVVNDGLSQDDMVIVEGLQRSRPGAKVDPQQIELPAATDAVEAVSTSGAQPPSPPLDAAEAAENSADTPTPQDSPPAKSPPE